MLRPSFLNRQINTVGRPLKLLTSDELSRRVTKLCKKGDLNNAITMVKQAPLDAQSPVVWANLIQPVMAAGKYQQGFRLFTDMKRRGLRPTLRTYGTVLKGYCQINDWEKFTLQLKNVNSVYEQVSHHCDRLSREAGKDKNLSNIPYNLLIVIFGKAQKFQRMYDVFNSMPETGPLAPDLHTFTALLTAIGNRRVVTESAKSTEEWDDPVTSPELVSPPDLTHKNASDARFLWRQLIRTCQQPDTHAIHAVLKPLLRGPGRPSDQMFALDIVRDYLGLAQPGAQAPPPKLPLHAHTLEIVLHACNRTRRYHYTLNYVRQLVDTARASVLNKQHMDLVLQAHAALAPTEPGQSAQALEILRWMLRMYALPRSDQHGGGIGPQIAPDHVTYELVARACEHDGSWENMCRTFELMTSCSLDKFRGSIHDSPKPQARRPDANRCPNAAFLSTFVRMAGQTREPKNVQIILNILDYFGIEAICGAGTARDGRGTAHPSSPGRESKPVVDGTALAKALEGVFPLMIENPSFDDTTRSRWKQLRTRIRNIGN